MSNTQIDLNTEAKLSLSSEEENQMSQLIPCYDVLHLWEWFVM